MNHQTLAEAQEELKRAKKKNMLLTLYSILSTVVILIGIILKIIGGGPTILTGIRDKTDEDNMVNSYLGSAYQTALDNNAGIMHHVPTLYGILKNWYNDHIDSVAFKFSRNLATDSDPNECTILMVPVVNRTTRIPFVQSNQKTWSVDLGDLYP